MGEGAGVQLGCGRGEEGACLGLGRLSWCRESDKVVEAAVEHHDHSSMAAQELEELLLVPGALVLEEGVCRPAGWVMEVEAVHVHGSVCVQPQKASC